jgi:hypothetical protein
MPRTKALTKESITRDAKVLVASIRNYIKSQRRLWRKVPWLALHANGQSGGFRDALQYCYLEGIWGIFVSMGDGHYQYVFVDCDSGEIVNSPSHPETDENVMRLLGYLDNLDAASVIERLEAKAREKTPRSAAKTHGELQEWREEIIERTGLKKIYRRPPGKVKNAA